jgi:hypothetical protein
MKGDELDPKALILEAYRIDGITASECRSIFLDWALSLPASVDARSVLPTLITRYGDAAPDHPMSAVLHDGLNSMTPKGRRGGRQARFDS